MDMYKVYIVLVIIHILYERNFIQKFILEIVNNINARY